MSGGGLLQRGTFFRTFDSSEPYSVRSIKEIFHCFFYHSMRDPGVRSTHRRVRVFMCQLIQAPQPRRGHWMCQRRLNLLVKMEPAVERAKLGEAAETWEAVAFA